MNITKLLELKKTVFTVEDLQKILDTNNKATIRNYMSRAKEKWLVESIYYWIWKVIWRDVEIFELACKINKNSYISFETVLKKEWVIFQYYDSIFLASDKSVERIALGKIFKTFKMKKSILLNPIWIIQAWNYSIASKERAICDKIYLSKNYYFDDLSSIDFKNLEDISKIYNKRVEKEINSLIEKHAK
ncbi:MAG: hypothetical protein ACD_3C00071G0007 [uncultured bacterium (gcode 4)]|uniref:Uncharacterized protein n=1 Tax=uncultured bacterium (gcode 4) TaxID=1234023 RepID=K2G275_9BACT|nr:MAG: hypothetical protein ACD_3C00071G0007 [uncultured bacterium (gcode 4)]